MISQRRRLLFELIFKDCATAILTEVFDGVCNRLEDGAGALPTEEESAWMHNEIGKIADRFARRGQERERVT